MPSESMYVGGSQLGAAGPLALAVVWRARAFVDVGRCGPLACTRLRRGAGFGSIVVGVVDVGTTESATAELGGGEPLVSGEASAATEAEAPIGGFCTARDPCETPESCLRSEIPATRTRMATAMASGF